MKYEIELEVENADTICIMTENNDTGIAMRYIPVKPIRKDNLYKRWRANNNSYYYYITGFGNICSELEFHATMDNEIYDFGNYYKTKEEAKFALERQRVMNELELYSIKDETEIKETGFYVLTCGLNKCYNQIKPTHLYNAIEPFTFATLEDAEAAIEAIGEERLKKYYFKVK